MARNILVTGGFGFVGGYLIDRLTKSHPSNHVHVVDDLSSNPIPYKKLLSEIGFPENLTYDLCSIQEFCRRAPEVRWDEIYHLASVVGPAGILPHAGKIVRSIITDTYLLIDLAQKYQARLLDVSTSEIYGGGQEGLCSELFPKVIPAKTNVRLEYAIAKLAAETALINTSRVSSLDAVIVRPFNIAGPRQSGAGGFVLPRFIACAIQDKPLTVFGDGSQIRSFTHVLDIATGLEAAMHCGNDGEAYNIGSSQNKVTIDVLADLVIEITQSRSRKTYVDPKKIYGPLYEEANDKYPDAAKAHQELDWFPEHSLEFIIRSTYEYMLNADEETFSRLAGILQASPV